MYLSGNNSSHEKYLLKLEKIQTQLLAKRLPILRDSLIYNLQQGFSRK